MADFESQEGRVLVGRYRIQRLLGRGGMSSVWAAHDEVLRRDVAIKEIVPPFDLSPAQRELIRQRTIREVGRSAQIAHPSVVTVYDVIEEQGRPWIVMQLLRAQSLADRLAERGRLTPTAAARIGVDVLEALQAAHALEVIHRDVTPRNILLPEGGPAVVTDFGVATVQADPTLTSRRMLVGAPDYMPPERAQGGQPNAATDLWSFGATLYAAVEGVAPFHRSGPLSTLKAVSSEPVPIAEHAGLLQPIIADLLATDPQARPDADLVRAGLLQILHGEATPPAPARAEPAHPAQLRSVPMMRPVSQPIPVSQPLPVAPPLPVKAARRWPKAVPASALVAVIAVAVVVILTWDQGKGRDPVAITSATSTPSGSKGSSLKPASVGQASTRTAMPKVTKGFRTYKDPTGFSLAVPAGWVHKLEGSGVYFVDPKGASYLVVDRTGKPKADPLRDWRIKASSAAGLFPGYRLILIERIAYKKWNTADWEYTWRPAGQRMRVVNRNIRISDKLAYTLLWSVPAVEWQQRHEDFRRVVGSFTPAQ
jgi:serine/threonine protein kinase